MSVRRGGRGGGPAGLWGGHPPGSGDRYFSSSSSTLSPPAPHHSSFSSITSAFIHGSPCPHPVPPPPPFYSGVSPSHSTTSQGFASYPSTSHPPPQGWRGGRGGHQRYAPRGGSADPGHSRGGRGGRGRAGDARPFRGRGRGGFNKGCLTAVSCPGWLDDPWGELHSKLMKEFPRLEMPLDASSPEVAKWRREQEEITWDIVSGSSCNTAHRPASEREKEMVSSEGDVKHVHDERGHQDDSESMAIVEGSADGDSTIPTHTPAGDSQDDTCAAQERKESSDQQDGDEQCPPPVSGGTARKRVRDGETLSLPATVSNSTRVPLKLPPIMHGPKNERLEKDEEGESSSTESQGGGASHSSSTKESDNGAEEAVHVEAATCAPEPRKSLLFSLPPPVMGGEKPSSPACNRRDFPDAGMSSFSLSSSSASPFSSVSTSLNGACSAAACTSSAAELSFPGPQRSDSSSSSDTPSAPSSASPHTGAAALSPLRAGQSETGAEEPASEGPLLGREKDKGEPQGRSDKPDDAGGGELCLDLTTLRQRLQERGQREKGRSH
ncbi:hypothetical protein CSUI_002947 [Cystoisospora suis]|uniref:Uncharacterized protein n=1 Tax=Cystoisospora suis TaxID=483139 RepID=A0A2C6L2S3_9APIC|nr:hypothetical protein CSUI_002947 [Cystoisospora suis]